MKKCLLLLPGCLLFVAATFTDPPTLVGRWQPKASPGFSVVTVFRPVGTFDIFVNNKTFVSGTYKVSGDTLAISDPGCGVGYYGTYRLAFLTPDSVRMTLLQDTCRVRRTSSANSPTLGRVKSTKP